MDIIIDITFVCAFYLELIPEWETTFTLIGRDPRNVNPMLALRTGECNDRWDETRKQAFRHRLQTRLSTRLSRQKKRYEQLKQKVEKDILRLVFLSYLYKPKTANMPSIPC